MNKIIWQKWKDPFAHLLESKLKDDDDDTEYQSSQDSFLGPGEYRIGNIDKSGNTGPAIVGPLGIIPLHEHNLPSKIYNFWIGHTNFDITQQIFDKINCTAGVETLDVFTRYRFRVGFGVAFKQEDVKKEIENSVCPKQVIKQRRCPMQVLQDGLNKQYKYWTIYKMENSKVNIIGGDSIEDVEERGFVYNNSAKEIIKSWIQKQ